MLTQTEAEELVISRFKLRHATQDVSIGHEQTSAHDFGWLFYLKSPESSMTEPRLFIVNKHVAQVIGTSIPYTPEQFVKVYESLLALSQIRAGNWCLFPAPDIWGDFINRRIAEKAEAKGLYPTHISLTACASRRCWRGPGSRIAEHQQRTLEQLPRAAEPGAGSADHPGAAGLDAGGLRAALCQLLTSTNGGFYERCNRCPVVELDGLCR